MENGRIRDRLLNGLHAIAELGVGRFILTPNQNLVLADIPPERKAAVADLLHAYGLDASPGGLRRNALACVALPTCGLALAESERYLPDLVSRLEDELDGAGLAQDDITIRMTGCPNGCARPYLAEIGLVGRTPGIYHLYLGGAFDGSRLKKLSRKDIDGDAIVAALSPLLREYADGDAMVKVRRRLCNSRRACPINHRWQHLPRRPCPLSFGVDDAPIAARDPRPVMAEATTRTLIPLVSRPHGGRFAHHVTTHDHWIIAASLADIGLGDTKPCCWVAANHSAKTERSHCETGVWERENDIIGVRRHRGALHELRVAKRTWRKVASSLPKWLPNREQDEGAAGHSPRAAARTRAIRKQMSPCIAGVSTGAYSDATIHRQSREVEPP